MKKITNFFNSLVQRYFPDPLILGVFMLVAVFLSGFLFTPSSPADLLSSFGTGFWSMLAFTMQLSLVLLASSAIANTKGIKKALVKLASIPKTPSQAVFFVAITTSLVGVINWGIALVAGIIFAKEVAKQVKGTHYPLLIAASYIGFTLWSSGLSSSIPLTLNTPGHPIGGVDGTIPLTETIFTGYNLIITLALLLTYALVSRFMTPAKEYAIAIDPEILAHENESANTEEVSGETFAAKLDHNRIITIILGAICLLSFGYSFYIGGINSINLNTINMLVIGVGLLLYKGVRPYLEEIGKSVQSVVPLLIGYPIYGAISSLIVESGMGTTLTEFFASMATAETLPLLTYISAGLLNLFIPAAGGQIIIQGPIFLPIAEQLGVSQGLVAMAVTYGDTWTNLLQPFWALPALALAGLGIRHIMGFCIVAMIVSGIITGSLLYLLPFIL